jgi:hypothetical protein
MEKKNIYLRTRLCGVKNNTFYVSVQTHGNWEGVGHVTL